jgi:maltooligosyltrehalose trehalohydrolase
MRVSAHYLGQGRCEFVVWAPLLTDVSLKLVEPSQRVISMKADGEGYWRVVVEEVLPGTLYYYELNDRISRPDPGSHYQPRGVHGPSQVIDPTEFSWEDPLWRGISLKDFIVYELHVGTFTREGTFESILPYLNYLQDLGVTAVELMPVCQFPGVRNWGYDGVYPFAPQNSYGGPNGLKSLVNACHKAGLAVILDVVYNHLGPEGNYLSDFAPYFTKRYKTPWGAAINFDGPYSDGVRRFFIHNALYWITEYRMDALRIDAIHGIFDFSAKHFLHELSEAVQTQAKKLGRHIYVIAESGLNDARVVSPVKEGGYGLDAQWNDDFHHALHALLTGERNGYYQDFGNMRHLEKALREGFVYSGEYSRFRKRRHGNSSKERPAEQFVVFSQNHDQVGNRMQGDRLSQSRSLEELKLAAGAVVLSPYLPLLFMGEEYGETAPFQYFVDHGDPDLIEAVRKGRVEEFASFGWADKVPDPEDEATFLNSKIKIEAHRQGHHRLLLNFYKELIRLRKDLPALSRPIKENAELEIIPEKGLLTRRWIDHDALFFLYNFGHETLNTRFTLPEGLWYKVLDSAETVWGGNGGVREDRIKARDAELFMSVHPYSFVLYRRSKRE